MSRSLCHAAPLHHRGKNMQIAQLQAASDAVVPFSDRLRHGFTYIPLAIPRFPLLPRFSTVTASHHDVRNSTLNGKITSKETQCERTG
jgi:hypothetical protein